MKKSKVKRVITNVEITDKELNLIKDKLEEENYGLIAKHRIINQLKKEAGEKK